MYDMTFDATDVVDVAMGFDGRYAAHAATVISSIVRAAPGAKFRFILLYADVSEVAKDKCEAVAPQCEFVWREVSDADLPPFADREHFSRATLFRLGLESLAPADCHRVLFLDSDIIVVDDLRKLWAVDIAPNPIGAVTDCYVDPVAFAKKWGLENDKPPKYFNAGILVIDLDKVREEKLFSKAAAFVAKHDRDLPFNDQDALNWSIWMRWTLLDVSWNVMRPMVILSLEKEIPLEQRLRGRAPSIVHYTGPEKPWIKGAYHPWAWLYWKNVTRTPFLKEVEQAQGVGVKERIRLWLRWLVFMPPAPTR